MFAIFIFVFPFIFRLSVFLWYRLNEAVRSVFLHLTGPMAWARERVVIIGRSLGSGPATFLAREFHPGVRIHELLKFRANYVRLTLTGGIFT